MKKIIFSRYIYTFCVTFFLYDGLELSTSSERKFSREQYFFPSFKITKVIFNGM